MSAAPEFTSVLGPVIARYLALKEALGRRYANERAVVRSLDTFLATTHASDLTAASFDRWCQGHQHLTATVRRNRMRIVRNLCLYRRREADCFVPDRALFPRPHQAVRPYIFSTAEIARLLDAARRLVPRWASPVRGETFHAALVLLYTAGLRRGELLRLTLEDYDPAERTLLVRASKFHKSRLLPLSPDGTRAVDGTLRARQQRRLPVTPESPFLWHRGPGGPGYTGVGLGTAIRALLRTAQIRRPDGRLPRIHDFRHTFAVHALLRWYRAGADVQTKLPLLATYMGHVSIVSTQYYLPFVEALAAAAATRFADRCGRLLEAPGAPGGAP